MRSPHCISSIRPESDHDLCILQVQKFNNYQINLSSSQKIVTYYYLYLDYLYVKFMLFLCFFCESYLISLSLPYRLITIISQGGQNANRGQKLYLRTQPSYFFYWYYRLFFLRQIAQFFTQIEMNYFISFKIFQKNQRNISQDFCPSL